jgi:hypothetical protein
MSSYEFIINGHTTKLPNGELDDSNVPLLLYGYYSPEYMQGIQQNMLHIASNCINVTKVNHDVVLAPLIGMTFYDHDKLKLCNTYGKYETVIVQDLPYVTAISENSYLQYNDDSFTWVTQPTLLNNKDEIVHGDKVFNGNVTIKSTLMLGDYVGTDKQVYGVHNNKSNWYNIINLLNVELVNGVLQNIDGNIKNVPLISTSGGRNGDVLSMIDHTMQWCKLTADKIAQPSGAVNSVLASNNDNVIWFGISDQAGMVLPDAFKSAKLKNGVLLNDGTNISWQNVQLPYIKSGTQNKVLMTSDNGVVWDNILNAVKPKSAPANDQVLQYSKTNGFVWVDASTNKSANVTTYDDFATTNNINDIDTSLQQMLDILQPVTTPMLIDNTFKTSTLATGWGNYWTSQQFTPTHDVTDKDNLVSNIAIYIPVGINWTVWLKTKKHYVGNTRHFKPSIDSATPLTDNTTTTPTTSNLDPGNPGTVA